MLVHVLFFWKFKIKNKEFCFYLIIERYRSKIYGIYGIFSLLVFLFIFWNYISTQYFFNFEIILQTTCFFQFPTSLEFVIANHKIEYFNKEQYKHCNLCNFTSDNQNSNSTKRDVVFSFASQKVYNFALFQRTLRTTGSNATIVLILDNESFYSIDSDTLKFTEECGTQIIKCPSSSVSLSKQATKNYMFHIAYLFFKQNEGLIDRIIFLDLFDGLFLADPFNDFIKYDQIHMSREHMMNEFNPMLLTWINQYDPKFNFDIKNKFINTINSGYFGAFYDGMIVFLRVFLEYTKFNNAIDQGLINLMYFRHMLRPYGYEISPENHKDRVTHFSYMNPSTPFTEVRGSDDRSVKASIIHLYYNGNENFRKSILKVCPRITNKMKNYLDVNCPNITSLEEGLDEWDPAGKIYQ